MTVVQDTAEADPVLGRTGTNVQDVVTESSWAPEPPLPSFADLRVLIVHDWIVAWGGAERTLEQLLIVFPQADLVVGVLGEGRRDLNDITRRARESWLGRMPFARTHHRWYLPLYAVAFSTVETRGYDLVVSSSHAFAKMVRASPDALHLCYCHSPPRYLWDLHAHYRRGAEASGLALRIAGPLLRLIDRLSARRVDAFLANSLYIAERIRRCYDRDAAVVYPPVSAKPVARRESKRDDVLLSLGRLVQYKRVDLAIEAANHTGERLIVAGDGPERERLERLAGPSVTFLGEVTEEQAGELMERCRAMVFCGEEDFGIAPVEANAHGLPVIAFGRGGAVESLQQGVSAEFFDTQSVDALIAALARAQTRAWSDSDIRANASRFSAERFREGIARQVMQLYPPAEDPVVSVGALD